MASPTEKYTYTPKNLPPCVTLMSQLYMFTIYYGYFVSCTVPLHIGVICVIDSVLSVNDVVILRFLR